MSYFAAIESSSAMIPLFCKTSISSPETLTLNLHGFPSLSSPCSSSGSCLSSSLRTRIQKSPSMLRNFKKEDSCVVDSEFSSATPLRMKRPARIDIPVTPLSFVATAMTVVVAELEVERENFSVYCKKGRWETMENRYSTVVDLQGDPIQLMWRDGMRWTEEDGALGLLLETARRAFSVDAMEPAEGILLIVESLTMEANESDISIIESMLRVTNEENGTGKQTKKIVIMFLERLCHPSGLKKSTRNREH